MFVTSSLFWCGLQQKTTTFDLEFDCDSFVCLQEKNKISAEHLRFILQIQKKSRSDKYSRAFPVNTSSPLMWRLLLNRALCSVHWCAPCLSVHFILQRVPSLFTSLSVSSATHSWSEATLFFTSANHTPSGRWGGRWSRTVIKSTSITVLIFSLRGMTSNPASFGKIGSILNCVWKTLEIWGAA